MAGRETDKVQLQPLLLRPRDVARLLGVSRRTIDSWRASGRLPPAMKLGGCLLWKHADLVSWVEQGCPPVERFIKLRQEKKR